MAAILELISVARPSLQTYKLTVLPLRGGAYAIATVAVAGGSGSAGIALSCRSLTAIAVNTDGGLRRST